jgi:hypothetical protein
METGSGAAMETEEMGGGTTVEMEETGGGVVPSSLTAAAVDRGWRTGGGRGERRQRRGERRKRRQK